MNNKERIKKAKEYAVKNELLNAKQADGIIDFIKNNELLYTDGNGNHVADQKTEDRILLEQFGIILLCLSGNYEKNDPSGFMTWLNEARIDENKITDMTTAVCSWDATDGISVTFNYDPYMEGAMVRLMISPYNYTIEKTVNDDFTYQEAFEYGKRLADFLANLYGVKKTIKELPETEKEEVVRKHLDELLNAFGRDVEAAECHGYGPNMVTYVEVTYRSMDGNNCQVRNRVHIYEEPEDVIAQVMHFIDFVCECEQIGYADIKYIELKYSPYYPYI